MTTLTLRAEQALLGSMLAEPELVSVVSRYLTPGDFLSERNSALYACMLESRDGQPPGRAWRAHVERAAGLRGIPGRYLNELDAACPEPSHGLSYGALVMRASARREVDRYAAVIASGSAGPGSHAGRLVRADATGGHRTAVFARQAAGVASAMRAHTHAFDPDSTHAVAAPPAAAGNRARKEELVLAALLQRHPDTAQILALLTEDAFSGAERREMFRAIENLHINGRDIDPVTVDWQTERGHDSTVVRRPASPHGGGQDLGYATRLAATEIAATTVTRMALTLAERSSPDCPAAARPGSAASQGAARLIQPPPDLPASGHAPTRQK